jgi:uncharacterized protein YbbC (DUF1343 family)
MGFRVLTGLENLEVASGPGVNAALVCNQASVDAGLRRTGDRLVSMPGINLRMLLAPEHGLYGVEQDMIPVGDGNDAGLGVQIKSLYGRTEGSLTPDVPALSGIDVLFFDLQDVGSRYYTWISTLVNCMRACAEAGVKVVVLDRPNPLGGVVVEGGGVGVEYRSFVGVHDISVRHGMTLGELAGMIRDEAGMRCELEVVKMSGWQRRMRFRETGLPWVAPSPNMPTARTTKVYPGMCLVEGTNMSEGRGTTKPFELCGAPFIEPFAFCRELNSLGLQGLHFRPEYFRPQFHKFAGNVCGGFHVHVTDPEMFRSYLAGVAVLLTARRMYGGEFQWRTEPYEFVSDKPAIDLLTGGDTVRRWIDEGRELRDFREMFEEGAAAFEIRREQWLLYK